MGQTHYRQSCPPELPAGRSLPRLVERFDKRLLLPLHG